MGSPSSRLNCKESLRPWIESGLEYVLSPGHGQMDKQVGSPQTASTPQMAPPQNQNFTQSQGQPSQQAQGMQSPQFSPQGQPRTPSSPQRTAPAPAGFSEQWAGFFAKAPQAPKIVWTYMELGLDFGGQADGRRRAILQKTITYMGWPPGAIAFWPMSSLVDGALQPDKEMFWKGWGQWRTPCIACFGEEALHVILPDAEPANTTYFYEHVTVHVLPPLAKMVTMLPHELQLAVTSLKNIRF